MPVLVRLTFEDDLGEKIRIPEIEELYLSEANSPDEVTLEIVANAMASELQRLNFLPKQESFYFTWEPASCSVH